MALAQTHSTRTAAVRLPNQTDIVRAWPKIRSIVAQGQSAAIHCAIASLTEDGSPTMAPIGTVFLRDDCSGFYFDHYAHALAHNLDRDPRVCVMAVNTNKLYWVRALLFQRFSSLPGVRLYGTAGPRREARPDELALVQRRIGVLRWLRGARVLWDDLAHVRDLRFTEYRPVSYPVMMGHLMPL